MPRRRSFRLFLFCWRFSRRVKRTKESHETTWDVNFIPRRFLPAALMLLGFAAVLRIHNLAMKSLEVAMPWPIPRILLILLITAVFVSVFLATHRTR